MYLNENTPDNELLLFDRSGSNVLLFNYYQDQKEYKIINLTWHRGTKLFKITPQELRRELDARPNFWLISSRNIKGGDQQAFLNTNYRQIGSRKYKDLELYYYQNEDYDFADN